MSIEDKDHCMGMHCQECLVNFCRVPLRFSFTFIIAKMHVYEQDFDSYYKRKVTELC